jgi:hypothetical protein
MICGWLRSGRSALLATVPVAVTALGGTEGKPPLTAAQDLVLSTKTPLGEAAIVLPAGSIITDAEEEGSAMVIRQGPFTARVSRGEIVFPEDAAAETIPTGHEQGRSEAAAGHEPVADETGAGAAVVWPWEEGWNGDWASLWPTGAVLALGAYSLVTTFALLRLRRRGRS